MKVIIELRKSESIFAIYDNDHFFKIGNNKRKPLYTIKVSESTNVYGLCEYDKKFLLLDIIIRGVCIIDIESRQKVAKSILTIFDG